MIGQNQADYMKYWQLFKGNYHKGVNALKGILSSSGTAKEFLDSYGGVSVIFTLDKSEKDKNSEELQKLLISNEENLEAAIKTLIKPYNANLDINSETSITNFLNNSTLMSKIAKNKTAMMAIASSKKMMAGIAKSKTALRAIVESPMACEAINYSKINQTRGEAGFQNFKIALLNNNSFDKVFEQQLNNPVQTYYKFYRSGKGVYYAEPFFKSYGMNIFYYAGDSTNPILGDEKKKEKYAKENPSFNYGMLFGEGTVYAKAESYDDNRYLRVFKMRL